MRENRTRRKPKVSYGRSVRVGLVGPKPRPGGVGDGQLVSIPAPRWQRSNAEGGPGRVDPAGLMDMVRFRIVGVRRQGNPPPGQAEDSGEVETFVKATGLSPGRREKPRCKLPTCPYRKPTLVGGGKYREANGRTFVKELGKLDP